jgi:hypothetical protein
MLKTTEMDARRLAIEFRESAMPNRWEHQLEAALGTLPTETAPAPAPVAAPVAPAAPAESGLTGIIHKLEAEIADLAHKVGVP